MPVVYKDVKVEIYLEDFDDQDLIDELEGRGYCVPTEDSGLKRDDIAVVLDWLYDQGYPLWLIHAMKEWKQCPWLFPVLQEASRP